MEVTGILEKKLDLQSGISKKTEKEWKSREFIINTGDQYNPHICIKLFGDKVDLIDKFELNQSINVSINISSREHKERWYTSIDGWKIEATQQAAPPNPPDNNKDADDELPF
jgi:hypothetical protein